MPNKPAAEKALRQSKKHEVKNRRMKMHVKALTARIKILVKEGKKDEAKTVARQLQQALGKAAKTHVFHKNRAASKISQAHKLLVK